MQQNPESTGCFTIVETKQNFLKSLHENFIPFLFSYSCREIFNVFLTMLKRGRGLGGRAAGKFAPFIQF